MRSAEELFRLLAANGEELEKLLTLAGKGRLAGAYDVNALTRLAGLARARQPDLVSALGAAEQAGIAMRQPLGRWAISLPEGDSRELATLLRGARLYREHVHRDNDRVFTVVSMPAAPSQLVDALNRTLEGVHDLESTEVVLGQLAARARSRFTVMTPFVDEDGAKRILALFALTAPSVRRELVVRDGLPSALQGYARDLASLRVIAYDFRISRPARGENETFHAKVIRVDDDECYVGSSNMTKWSFAYSLELGMHVKGEAGRAVSRVIDAVVSVSAPIGIG